MSSTTYGESLLQGIRDENEKTARTNERKARQGAWKAVGINAALGIAQNVANSKHQEFLNNEELVKNQLLLGQSYTEANNDLAAYQKSLDDGVGVEGLARQQLTDELTNQWQKVHGTTGNYNEGTFNKWLNKSVNSLEEKRVAALNERFDATKEYLTTGSAAKYQDKIKSGAPEKTLTGLVMPFVKGLTGNDNTDLDSLINDNMVTSTKQYQEDYGNAWRKTRNANVADYIAKNMPSDAGVPATVTGEVTTIKSQDMFGQSIDVSVIPTTTYYRNNDGNVVSNTTYVRLDGSGNVSQSSSVSDAEELTVAQVAAKMPANLVKQGVIEFNNQGAITAPINAMFEKQIDVESNGSIKSGDPAYAAQLLLKQEAFASMTVAAGLLFERQGMGTEDEGRKIYRQVALNRIAGEAAPDTIGQGNVFETLQALQDMNLTNKRAIATKLVNDDNKIYNALNNMGKEERDIFIKKLRAPNSEAEATRGFDFFRDMVDGNQLETTLDIMEEILNNPSMYTGVPEIGDKVTIAAQILDQKAAEDTTTTETTTTTTTTTSDANTDTDAVGKTGKYSVAEFYRLNTPEGEAPTYGRSKNLHDGQHKDYAKLERLLIKVKRREKQLNASVYKKGSPQLSRFEKGLEDFKKDYDDAYKAYSDKYGRKGTPGTRENTTGVLKPEVPSPVGKQLQSLLSDFGTPDNPLASFVKPEDASDEDYTKLYDAVAMIESNNDPDAVSPVGALGRMQVMPETLAQPGYGIKPAKDDSDKERTRVGQEYFKAMYIAFDGNLEYAAAAYNMGPGATREWIESGADKADLPKETRDYITRLADQLKG